jgi:hypothetical protein
MTEASLNEHHWHMKLGRRIAMEALENWRSWRGAGQAVHFQSREGPPSATVNHRKS